MSNSTFEPNARVELLDFTRAYPTLKSDLNDNGPCLAFTYLLDILWFEELFAPHLTHSLLMVIGDSRQRTTLRQLVSKHRKLKAATWSTNRTMHDKTLVFPQKNLVYLTTNNITRGSWTMSLNATARIESPLMCRNLEEQFHSLWNNCQTVEQFTVIK